MTARGAGLRVCQTAFWIGSRSRQSLRAGQWTARFRVGFLQVSALRITLGLGVREPRTRSTFNTGNSVYFIYTHGDVDILVQTRTADRAAAAVNKFQELAQVYYLC